MCNCDSLLKTIDAYIKKADDDLEAQLDEAGFAEPGETVNEITSLEESVAEILEEETNSIIESAESADDLETFANDIWPKIKKDDVTDQKLSELFVEELQTYLPEVTTYYAKQFDPEITVNQLTKRTTAWIQNWSAELGEVMKLNSHTEIESILSTGLEEGYSISQFTQAMMDSGIRDEYYKARRASITEVLRAHSYARQESIIQSPVVEDKEWKHTGSHKIEPRQNHVDMDGQIVPKDEPFELIGADGTTYYPMVPRDTDLPPEESIHCHCIHRGIVNEDILGLPLEERQRLQEEAIAEDDGKWEEELDAQNKAKAGI